MRELASRTSEAEADGTHILPRRSPSNPAVSRLQREAPRRRLAVLHSTMGASTDLGQNTGCGDTTPVLDPLGQCHPQTAGAQRNRARGRREVVAVETE